MDNVGQWDLYRSFLAVLEASSLSGAARALGTTQPTIGRHVAALEKSLSLTLFTRSQAGLTPTDSAHELKGYAEAMRSNAAALRRAAESQGEGIRGTVRIAASEVIGIEVLPPLVAKLQEAHPLLKIELLLSNRLQDLLRREADIAVRMTQPKQDQLVARRVGAVELGLYAHQDYLQKKGWPSTLADLRSHALIGFDEETPFLRDARKLLPVWERDAFSLRADSDVAQLALIRAGAGIGICQVAIAMRSTMLQRVLPDQVSIPLDTWLTMHEDLRNSSRCKVVFDALVHGLLEHTNHLRN
ncbi:MAG: LysR family transcriptional regulator [Pseudoxanthomonas sp.]